MDSIFVEFEIDEYRIQLKCLVLLELSDAEVNFIISKLKVQIMLAMQHLFRVCDVMYRLHYLLLSKYNLDICNKNIVVKSYIIKKK